MTVHTYPFERSVAMSWPFTQWREVTVVVAVSGGRDSVALLRALARLRELMHEDSELGHRAPPAGRLIVAHFNHHLRAAESDADEAFVRDLSQRLQLACETGHASRLNDANGKGLEAAARRHRYEFLRTTADRFGARYVATAHTADDHVETILHRIVRGTGVRGLAGIPARRTLSPLTTLVRPLLEIRRSEVESYLNELGQPFREDASNASLAFTRNRIRHELLPLLERNYNSRVREAIERLGELADQSQAIVDSLVATLCTQCVVPRDTRLVTIACTPLRNQPEFLVQELLLAVWRLQHWPLQDMSRRKWQQLSELVQATDSPLPPIILPGNIQARITDDILELKR